MTSDIPREGYELTTHARSQAKDRKIGLDVVGEVIEEGYIKQAKKPHQKQFVADIGTCKYPVSVVVDPNTLTVVTVQWYKDWMQ